MYCVFLGLTMIFFLEFVIDFFLKRVTNVVATSWTSFRHVTALLVERKGLRILGKGSLKSDPMKKDRC